jgi:predicted DNA-binding WGR domain protein
MNRWSLNDSKLSLDGGPHKHDHISMITQPYHLYVERTDASKNMARFYAMAIGPNLFGEACLTRCWGRIGTRGQTMCQHFASEREAVTLFLDLLRQKRQRGYSAVVYGHRPIPSRKV